MTDNELLLALSDMLDKKIEIMQNQIKNDIAELKQDVLLLKLDNENTIMPRLQNIESCYTSTYKRYKNSVESYEAMQDDIKLLKQVVREHSERLQKIS